jgi:hypothetical protein
MEEIPKHLGGFSYICRNEYCYGEGVELGLTILNSLNIRITEMGDTIERLEQKLAERDRKVIELCKKITRAIGWVEEVKCIGEQAQLEQRSFITELEIAALDSARGG